MKRPPSFHGMNSATKALLFFGLLFSTPLRAEAPGSTIRTLPLDVQIEILRVGGDGTQVLGMEEARILTGKGGALVVKELSLSAPGKKGVEKLSLRAEVRALSLAESSLVIGLRSRVNVLATTGVPLSRSEIRRDVSAEVSEGASELLEVYESAALASKLILNIRWFRAPADAVAGARQAPIPLTLRVYELGESAALRSENQLLAAVGGAATATFTRSVTFDEDKNGKRVRQERMEISLTPQYQVGQTLSLILEAAGEVLSLSPSAELSHPIGVREELFLDPRVPSSVEFEITAGDREREGWDRIRYRLEVTALF